MRHICNSAGIERFPERQLDMCRLGLGLYGIDPIDNRTLEHVATLRTTILQIVNACWRRVWATVARPLCNVPRALLPSPLAMPTGLDAISATGADIVW